jgi:Spy/CpxP family protein refolding chaperone
MMQIRSAAGRNFFIALVAALLVLPLSAQDGGFGPPPGGPPPDGGGQQGAQRGPSVERELKQLTKQLSLTTDQQSKVKTILTERNQKIGELMRSLRPPAQQGQQSSDGAQQGPPSQEQFEQLRTQMKAIRDDANSRISALLTAEQATKFAALLKQRKSHGDDGGMPDGPPPDGGMGGPPPDGGGPGGGGPPSF